MRKLLFIVLMVVFTSISASAQTNIEINGEKDNTGYLIRWTVTTDLPPYSYYVILYAVNSRGPKVIRKPMLLTWNMAPYGQYYLPVTYPYDFYFDIRNSAGEIVYTQWIKKKEIDKVTDFWEY